MKLTCAYTSAVVLFVKLSFRNVEKDLSAQSGGLAIQQTLGDRGLQ